MTDKISPKPRPAKKGEDEATKKSSRQVERIRKGGSSSNQTERSRKSSSNQTDRSEKLEESVPMELAVQAPTAEERYTGFKRIFMKLGRQVGIVKTSEFSKEYLEAVTQLDEYKEIVADLCSAVMIVCQQDKKYVPSAFSTQEFESPKDGDPIEKLEKYFPLLNSHFPNKEALAATREATQNLALAHRTLQQRVRRSLHFMRTFLNVDCHNIDEERRVLINCRQDMDFARHDYTNNPTDVRRITFERAQQRFNAQMDKVFGLLNQLPQKKIKHSEDLLSILVEFKNYHDTCAEECLKLRKYRAQFEPTPQYSM